MISHEDLLVEITKLGVAREANHIALRSHGETLDKHDARIKDLELLAAKMAGYSMAGSMLGALAIQLLMRFIR